MTVEQYIEWLEQAISSVEELEKKEEPFLEIPAHADQYFKWKSRRIGYEIALEKAREISRD